MSPAKTTRCIALLRGINVGKAKRIRMADLRELFEELGYLDVRTLLNSGNVLFTVEGRLPKKLGKSLREAILRELGVDANLLLLTAEEVERVLAENALLKKMASPSKLLVSLPEDPADLTKLASLKKGKDRGNFHVGSRASYSWCPDGILKSPLAKGVEKALGETVTSRNWGTLEKIGALLDEG